jgi:hypothetical protein
VGATPWRFKSSHPHLRLPAACEHAVNKAGARLEELRASVAAVEHSDRQALGAALVAGKAEPASKAAELKADIAEEERRVEALGSAVTDAHGAVGRLVKENRGAWRGQAMRTLSKARSRYEAAIAELEVHHIIPAKASSDLFFALSNLELVCRAHHEEREREASRVGDEPLVR